MRMMLAGSILLAMGSAANAEMSISFEWGPTKKCFDPNSPPIHLSGVPEGTVELDFMLSDLDAPNFQHGGGTVAYKGQSSLPYGAFKYKGPCPPSGSHTYVISVRALDASGKTLATA